MKWCQASAKLATFALVLATLASGAVHRASVRGDRRTVQVLMHTAGYIHRRATHTSDGDSMEESLSAPWEAIQEETFVRVGGGRLSKHLHEVRADNSAPRPRLHPASRMPPANTLESVTNEHEAADAGSMEELHSAPWEAITTPAEETFVRVSGGQLSKHLHEVHADDSSRMPPANTLAPVTTEHKTTDAASYEILKTVVYKSTADDLIEVSHLTEDQLNREIVSNQLKLKYFKSSGSKLNEDPEVLNLLMDFQSTYPSYSKYCTTPDGLVSTKIGPVVSKEVTTLASLADVYPEVETGGRYSPKNCSASNKVAIIVPFRGGEKNLATFLNHMHEFLMKQNIEYGIFVVRQLDGQFGEEHSKFNRGKLMNVGFKVAERAMRRSSGGSWDCYVFHDVDLLPLDTRNLYSCSPQPRRMSIAIDSLEPMGPYRIFFHRVLMISHRHFIRVNGFSNLYWGFAGVFDDMKNRLKYLHLEMEEFEQDGLSTLKYSIVNTTQHRLFSFTLVDIAYPNRENTTSNRRGYIHKTTTPVPPILQQVDSPYIEDNMGNWLILLGTFKETYPFDNQTYCQRPHRLGPIKADNTLDNLKLISKMYPEVKKGGTYSPDDCVARFKVAIIVPYRNRQENLIVFLRHMHWFLMKQKQEYGIFIIEQTNVKRFNRGKLMNVGYIIAKVARNGTWDCFVFHDVDLLPLDTRNLYSCTPQPRHMSIAIDKFNFSSKDNAAFGGASSMTGLQFEDVNGFPNRYWGWGGEDDDMYLRFLHLRTAARFLKIDGLNSIDYDIVKINLHHLYTRVLVNI